VSLKLIGIGGSASKASSSLRINWATLGADSWLLAKLAKLNSLLLPAMRGYPDGMGKALLARIQIPSPDQIGQMQLTDHACHRQALLNQGESGTVDLYIDIIRIKILAASIEKNIQSGS
jgi:hypothetical protein